MANLLADRLSASPPQADRPNRKRRLSRDGVLDLIGSAVAALAAVWLCFNLAGVALGFGFFFCWAVLSYAIYGILVWRRNGVLIMKDRLATVAVWTGAIIALVALLAVVFYVAAKGAPVVFAGFPRFLVNDMTGGKSGDAFGVGAAIVGTLEQVAIATVISVPIAFLTATYMVESHSWLARLVRNVVDAMTGTPSIIAGLFIYLIWVQPPRGERKIRACRGPGPVDHDDPRHLPGRARGHQGRARFTARSRLCARSTTMAGRPPCRPAHGARRSDHRGHSRHCADRRGDSRSPVYGRWKCSLQLEPVPRRTGRPATSDL